MKIPKFRLGLAIIALLCINSSLYAQQRNERDPEEYYLSFIQLKKYLSDKNYSDSLKSADKQFKRSNFVDSLATIMAEVLIQTELPTEFQEKISEKTRSLIAGVFRNENDDIYILVQVDRTLAENQLISNHLKDKLRDEIGNTIKSLGKLTYPSYSYASKKKSLIKFIQVSTGNDLFTLAGLWSTLVLPEDKDVKDGRTLFQRNDDRSYTGSMLIEVGTDYLNTRRRRSLKTYQTAMYGFEVFTPYFKSDSLFGTDTSFNPLDQPHGSFEFFGWSKKGLSRANKLRWAIALKFGKIGGGIGAKFQNSLHQDISYSPRPRGWGAQIANGGRLGISIEYNIDFFQYQLFKFKTNGCDDKNSHFGNTFINLLGEGRVGTYMTDLTAGLRLSNKSFGQNNHNLINHRTRQTVCGFFNHLMYEVSWKSTLVAHNTMLEGYGIFQTREKDNDFLTPGSRYYLSSSQVKRLRHTLDITFSYTSRFATFFYKWRSFSPDTKLKGIGIPSKVSGNELTLENRWHHFANIGVIFLVE